MSEVVKLLAELWPLVLGVLALVVYAVNTGRDAKSALSIARAAKAQAQSCEERIVALETGQKHILSCVRYIKDHMLMDPKARSRKREEI